MSVCIRWHLQGDCCEGDAIQKANHKCMSLYMLHHNQPTKWSLNRRNAPSVKQKSPHHLKIPKYRPWVSKEVGVSQTCRQKHVPWIWVISSTLWLTSLEQVVKASNVIAHSQNDTSAKQDFPHKHKCCLLLSNCLLLKCFICGKIHSTCTGVIHYMVRSMSLSF